MTNAVMNSDRIANVAARLIDRTVEVLLLLALVVIAVLAWRFGLLVRGNGRALRISEARFRSLIQNASDVIVIIDAAGVIRYVSPAIERVLKYAPDELVGHDAFALVHPNDIGAMRENLASIITLARATEPVQFRYRHQDGTWRWIEMVGKNLLNDPAVNGIVLNARDVTERERAAETIRAAERRYSRSVRGGAGVLCRHESGQRCPNR